MDNKNYDTPKYNYKITKTRLRNTHDMHLKRAANKHNINDDQAQRKKKKKHNEAAEQRQTKCFNDSKRKAIRLNGEGEYLPGRGSKLTR